MSKTPNETRRKASINRSPADRTPNFGFGGVLSLIDAAKALAVATLNMALIELYWSIGQHISRKTVEEGWRKGTVGELAETIRRRYPTMRGFFASNLWRMMQFCETYRDQPKLAALVRELSWSLNLAIMSRCKRDEGREFDLRLATLEHWFLRELERQLAGACSSESSCRQQNSQHRGQNCTRGAVEVFTCRKPPGNSAECQS